MLSKASALPSVLVFHTNFMKSWILAYANLTDGAQVYWLKEWAVSVHMMSLMLGSKRYSPFNICSSFFSCSLRAAPRATVHPVLLPPMAILFLSMPYFSALL